MDEENFYTEIAQNFNVYGKVCGWIVTLCSIGLIISFILKPAEWEIYGWTMNPLNPFGLTLFLLFFSLIWGASWRTAHYFRKCGKVLSLFHQWEKEVSYLSQIDFHPLLKEIISYGRVAINPLLVELNKRDCHVFVILAEITGENPVPREHRGNIPAMRQDWLAWGKRNKYL